MLRFFSQCKVDVHRQKTEYFSILSERARILFFTKSGSVPGLSAERRQAYVELDPPKVITVASPHRVTTPLGRSMAEGIHALQRLALLITNYRGVKIFLFRKRAYTQFTVPSGRRKRCGVRASMLGLNKTQRTCMAWTCPSNVSLIKRLTAIGPRDF